MAHPRTRSRDLLVKVARMYFLDDRSQDDIAQVVGTSRSNVSRMLSLARELGIVEFRFHNPDGRDEALEEALLQRFGLVQIRVAAFSPGADVRGAVGNLAAEWLTDSVRDGHTVGLSWGTTLQATVAAVLVERPRAVHVMPLVGGLSNTGPLGSSHELVQELAHRLGGTYEFLHGPAVLHESAARTALLTEPLVRDSLESARRVNIAMVGIGAFGSGSSVQLCESLDLTPDQRRDLLAAGPVGDICCRFFNAAGEEVPDFVRDRVLAVELADLRSIPTVMGVAAGAGKASAVLAALRGGLVRSLTLDAGLAHALLAADVGPR
jgi:DNA-binding transcriptional regulator LsrR (DeoR family)